jgi:xanthine dehydrogenase FAD-binding subunit
MLTCDEYLSPASLDEAFDAMERHRGRYRIVAGATDILPWAREGRAGDVHIPALIDVAGIPELNVRSSPEKAVVLGAATRFQRFLDDQQLIEALPVMPRCAVWFADDQIRESATIGGNIVNASPAADGTPALLVHGAKVELARRDGKKIARRTIALADFTMGPGKTVLGDGEIVTALTCDALPGYGAAFEKVGHRRSLVISTVCLTVAVSVSNDGRSFADVRIALAGVNAVPRRLTDIEAALQGAAISASLLEAAAEKAVPLVASRTRQDYRRDVVRGFMLRALVNAARRAGAKGDVIPVELEAAHA